MKTWKSRIASESGTTVTDRTGGAAASRDLRTSV